jgi:lipopolysaccharide/colanic/teichoic acid biosynthesis glycosyltransferase
VSVWWKRAFDLAVGVPALAASAPLIGALAVLVKLDTKGPAFFKQTRVGKGGTPLTLYKLRSMVNDAPAKGPAITSSGDPRVTRIGRLLRKTKLDELPQLLNVVRGEMSIVGPRPEAERYVRLYRPEWLKLLEVRPGITDLASLTFRHEEELLALAHDRERAYVEGVMPAKLSVALEGVEHSSPLYDLAILARTAASVLNLPLPEHPAVANARKAVESL